MLKIINVKIQRFRSIMDLTFDISAANNMITICGQNNVGKTNVLRAINLFFNPDFYEQKDDIPTIKHATWGGSVHPKIEVLFLDEKINTYYSIVRDFNAKDEMISSLNGTSFKGSKKKRLEKKELSNPEIDKILSRISFVYIESVNTFIPNLITNISQEVLNLQFDKSRFTRDRMALKNAYESYIDGLQEILNAFSNDISATFHEFKDNWNVEFHVPKNSDKFRDLISDDVTLRIQDKGSNGIEDKGSGLQRLAHILMEFEAADRMSSKKSIFICIDEPDIYLHEGLQRKLKAFFDKKAQKMQILLTTHSNIFIDTYKLENTMLLSCSHNTQYVVRKKKNVNVVETFKVDVNTDEGYEKICDHLGIEKNNYEILKKYNILVEGHSDKTYFEELSRFFSINCNKIISANGADNMEKYLDFYSSYYKDSTYKPRIKVILDNDSKGREVYKKLQAKTYTSIVVELWLLDNYSKSSNKQLERNNTNNELEDFLYPELVCYLVNTILNKKGLVQISEKDVCSKIKKSSFSSKGILEICEHEKNEKNPDQGNDIVFTSSGKATNNIKESMAGLLKIEGNRKLIALLEKCHKLYPSVEELLREIMEFGATQ